MAENDLKINELQIFDLVPASGDLFLATRDNQEIPVTGNFTYAKMFENVTVNAKFSAPLTANVVTTSTLVISQTFTPNVSVGPTTKGKLSWDENYLYIGISANKTKRIAWQDF
jgi:hypothetical protein